ncbi:hypothetical protein ACFORH_42715 [Amycolatopsis roodepoortensis]|uniref:Uncharacterized protein n=1 Tax=Amycolatopsis roodepoortensis TaxID=700274 RepID=A0ABR9L2Q5_9PSEU|nr:MULTISPECIES: hypothetical protein [Amycolatopsis]MBE1575043.1 hypothetical protein [Amycolatopsis roodepoortensis]GHG97329.1 hypothetical protein GCM10017788_76760 [Amycolatopsis acidiphila]
MADQTETAGADGMIDEAARVIHDAIATELEWAPGGEPEIVDLAAARALARRGQLADPGQRAEIERLRFLNGEAEHQLNRALTELRERTAERDSLRADYQQRDRQLRERTAQRDKALRERNARQARIEAALKLTEPHPLRHWDTQWPIREVLQGDQPAEPEPRLRRDNLGAVSIYFGPNGERVAYDETNDRYVPAPTSPSAVDSGEDVAKQCQYQVIPGTEPDRRGLCIAAATDDGFCQTHAEAMRAKTEPPAPFVPAADAFREATDG